MKISAGKMGRVFALQLEKTDTFPACIERFAAERGIRFATLSGNAEVAGGWLAPDAQGSPRLQLQRDVDSGPDGICIIAEILGIPWGPARAPPAAESTDTPARPPEAAPPLPRIPAADDRRSEVLYLYNAEFH